MGKILAALCALSLAAVPAGAEDPFLDGLRLGRESLQGSFVKVREGFFAPKRAPAAVAGAARSFVRLRTAPWRLLDRRHRGCSAFFISPDGYLLTAAHCVREDLPRAAAIQVGRRTLVEHGADVTLYGESSTRMTAGWRPVRLVASGRGYGVPNELETLKTDPAGLERLRRVVLGDWAIIKIDARSPAGCARVSTTAPRQGDELWALGYAGKAPRPDGQGSSGRDLAMTTGKAITDLTQTAWWEAIPPERQEMELIFHKPAFEAGQMILTDGDIAHGMSGGPIFERGGAAVGVSTMGPLDSSRYWTDASFGVTVKKVQDDLRAAGLDPSAYFSCR